MSSEFKHVLATGNFQTWLTETSTEELEKTLLRMEIVLNLVTFPFM
jgi:hypothetical protein